MNIRWIYPSTDGISPQSGPNDPIVTPFAGNYNSFLAREIIQNSIDARLDYSRPVTVTFSKEKVTADQIPDIGNLQRAIKLSDERFGDDNLKFHESCARALDLIRKNFANLLRISDYNTRGLEGGDNDIDGSFCKLVRSAGINASTGVGGGSYGIGKGAPFAASFFRTVLYSTKNRGGEYIFSGSSRLCSFVDENTDIKQGIGFLLDDNSRISIRDYEEIPAIFRRNEEGTDICILGYRDWYSPNWKSNLIITVLNNFWMAIANNNLIVKMRDTEDEEIIISQDTLEDHMETYLLSSEAQLKDNKAYNAIYYYLSYKDPDLKKEVDIDGLGRCVFYLKIGEGLPRKVVTMRKPQIAVEYLRFTVIPEGYAGVFICDNDYGNNILRQMEPPEHNRWDKSLLHDGGATIIDNIKTYIKEWLKESSKAQTLEPEEIPGLNDYLPRADDRDDLIFKTEDSDGEEGEGTGMEWGKEHTIDKTIEPTSAMARPILKSTAKLPGQGGGNIHTSNRRSEKVAPKGSGGGSDDGSGIKFIEIDELYFRAFPARFNGASDFYRIILRSPAQQSGFISLRAVGDDKSYDINILEAYDIGGNKLAIENNCYVPVELKAGEDVIYYIRLEAKNKRLILEVA